MQPCSSSGQLHVGPAASTCDVHGRTGHFVPTEGQGEPGHHTSAPEARNAVVARAVIDAMAALSPGVLGERHGRERVGGVGKGRTQLTLALCRSFYLVFLRVTFKTQPAPVSPYFARAFSR